jgi:hypothetical protein
MTTLYTDADTLVYASAAQEEINQCLAKYIPSGKEKLFPSKTEFNKWLKEHPKWKKEDFEFTQVKALKCDESDLGNEEANEEKRISYACANMKRKVAEIVDSSGCDDFRVCIQGTGNFRKLYQTPYVQYKAQRTEKPLLHSKVVEYAKAKYGARCIIVDGEETDDYVCRMGWLNYNKHKCLSKSEIIIAYCDKDIPANTNGALLNYNKLDEGVFWNDDLSRAKAMWNQYLRGDVTDNIDGIIELHSTTKAKYGIKHKGCGELTAEKILADAKSEVECAERVVEAYSLQYPDDWRQRMQDMGFFLYLRRKENEMFVLADYLESIGCYINKDEWK